MIASRRRGALLAVLSAVLLAAACASSTPDVPVATGATSEPTDAPTAGVDTGTPDATSTTGAVQEPTPAPTAPAPSTDPAVPATQVTTEPAAEAGTSLADIDRAERAWLQSGIVDYRYILRQSCECDDAQRRPRVVTVVDARVDVRTEDGELSEYRGYTADQLFEAGRESIRRGEMVEMDFAANGFPTGGIYDVEATWVDGGFVYDTEDLEILAEGPPVDDAFIDALRRWRSAGVDSYVMTYRPVCFCPEVEVSVTVLDGSITGVETSETYGLDIEPRTVEGLFAAIRRATNGGAHAVTAEYHPSDGRPVSIFVDEDPQIADEEYGYEVITFDAAVEPIETDPPERRPDDLAGFCEALARIEAIDDPPDTAAEARELLSEMYQWANAALETAPPDLAAGAAEFLRFLEAVSELAEANDWNPELFEALDDGALAGFDIDLGLVLEFGAATNTHCEF